MQEQIAQHIDFFAQKIESYKAQGKRLMASSSFQSHSIPMLKILASIDRDIPVYFLNTGFHFPESIAYKNQIAEWLGLRVLDLYSAIPKVQQLTPDGHLLFAQQPDTCCYLNKTLPMDPILAAYDVWITGVRRDQNENRRQMDYEAKGKYGITRFHPMLDWTVEQITYYMQDENMPPHPLEAEGYHSIGCAPCTQKPSGMSALSDRGGRWSGMKKTECGLHTDLIEK
ncbi:phosphoadenylyl-sulfate reductase [bacterium]|nr:phosphoadenylyl-sulfate reductase [bacterium]